MANENKKNHVMCESINFKMLLRMRKCEGVKSDKC